MALAKNLNKKPISRKKFAWPSLNKKGVYAVVFLAVLLGVYGVVSLARVIPTASEKKEIKFETGDQPLPQKISLWVTAEGGLYMRANPEPKSKIVILIPAGTQLSAEDSEGEWYKVSYMNKTGWVNKGYVTTTPPAEEPTKDYKSLVDKASGFSLRYPKDWVYQNYSENKATSSTAYYAFGAQLPAALDPATLPPVVVRISSKSKTAVDAEFRALKALSVTTNISNLSGTKYSYTSSSGTQMTAYVVGKGTVTYILEETGGFENELNLIIKTFVLN